MCDFTDLIDASRTPTLYLVHSLLPHVPYVYLPSGRRYAIDAPVLRGMRNGHWQEPWPTTQSYQRYLLQLGYTDRALGLVLERLRATGVYDRALVIVAADHGVSFRLGAPRRLPTRTNLDDIAFVPLFVKLPGQKQGRIDDSLARTIDIVPTVARVLGISPEDTPGRAPARRREAARRRGVWVLGEKDGSRVTARSRSSRRDARGRSRGKWRRSAPGRSRRSTGSARTAS